MILAGDVGGTKANLALFEERGGSLEAVREDRFSTADWPGLAELVGAFLEAGSESVDRACFGVAGPVIGDTIELTNAGWQVDRSALRGAIGVDRVRFLNDLEATVYGVDVLPAERLETLATGEARGTASALIAAGTGLGMAVLVRVDGRARAIASEGGHVDFAPRNEDEMALHAFLHARHGHVSTERVVSGPGIRTIYEFLRETGREEEPAGLAERLADAADPSAEISDAALDREPAICVRAMEMFVDAYGAAAGNLALTALGLGGLYVGGGIAPRILPLLRADDRFLRAFRAKGRLTELLSEVPVHVVLEPRAALLGAARYATLADRPSLRPGAAPPEPPSGAVGPECNDPREKGVDDHGR